MTSEENFMILHILSLGLLLTWSLLLKLFSHLSYASVRVKKKKNVLDRAEIFEHVSLGSCRLLFLTTLETHVIEVILKCHYCKHKLCTVHQTDWKDLAGCTVPRVQMFKYKAFK